ncbi:hypothetical protein ciss_23800 [Carboxydothermus islandicus]|uniref:acetate--CoA ligase n=1 Tax=Carboxydothermus islandicus TaxID=661089 RepID=A0A1L8D5U1_9THEO|nr:AMP-binding protein [Carboxydothermus islandicus]GAV26447.1 hypothetical protein ciss_23800 [Carboxydothermus islandicus]
MFIPEEHHLKESFIARFMARWHFKNFEELIKAAYSYPDWFYSEMAKQLDLTFFTPYEKIEDLSRGWHYPKYFNNAGFNIAYDAVVKKALNNGEKTAIIVEKENSTFETLSFEQLYREIKKAATVLANLGISLGDRVAIYLPMIKETPIFLLALAYIGAVAVPVFSGYGFEAVRERVILSGAKLLITADGFSRRGQEVPLLNTALEAVKDLNIAILAVTNLNTPKLSPNYEKLYWYNELNKQFAQEISIASTRTEDPLLIIYTSGTTGKPKGTLHTHIGFPVKSAIDMLFAFDIGPEDKVFWITDLGWMMGPWLIYGTLLIGGTVVLYEGSPDYPSRTRLWELIEKHQISVLGLSPTLIRLLMTFPDADPENFSFKSLRILGSTGEPWTEEAWQWFFEKVGKKKLPIINYSGGTEISGGILASYPIHKIPPCAFTGVLPGINADVVDENGKPVRNRVGELVIKGPWNGITRGFFNEPERFEQTYFSRFGPDLWAHGDWAKIDENGYWYILGRSDDTIKVAGKRLGPAEVENIVNALPEIAESAAFGIPHPIKGEALVVVAVPNKTDFVKEELIQKIKNQIATKLSKALSPEDVLIVKALPKTRNGKILRRLIRESYLGEVKSDTFSLENPQALAEIQRERRE